MEIPGLGGANDPNDIEALRAKREAELQDLKEATAAKQKAAKEALGEAIETEIEKGDNLES